ncbi:hypothetical protein [Devosia sp. Root635]|uniref:hypothetical protein n=1 Tax=Devosia sp. Root635 TaxID=1736575 RepID=UPI000700F7B4|nr:hypothetical protein [Devosia sp. Root635]KRA53066.1 hypothetical protein ASD80_13815 [Devosia sp. Root635]
MHRLAYAATIALASLMPAAAQDTAAGKLHIELNNAQTIDGACQLTFVMLNKTGTTIEKSAYNMAVVNTDQQVATLITFEFRPLVPGQTKVQQFALPGLACEAIAGLLINDFTTCDTAEGPSPLCETAIEQSTATPIAFPWNLAID